MLKDTSIDQIDQMETFDSRLNHSNTARVHGAYINSSYMQGFKVLPDEKSLSPNQLKKLKKTNTRMNRVKIESIDVLKLN